MAAFIVFSGPLIMCSLFSRAFVVLFLLAGLMWIVMDRAEIQKQLAQVKGPPFPILKWIFIIALLFIDLIYLGAVAQHIFSQYDDVPAYFYLAKKLLSTGTLFDPFSFRMLGALGGQLALSNLVFAFLPWKYGHLLDAGIGFLIVLGLTMEMVPKTGRRGWYLSALLLLLAIVLVIPTDNTASEYTGTILFLSLFKAFDLVESGHLAGWRAALCLGGIAGALITLRCFYIWIVLALIFAWFGLYRNHAGSWTATAKLLAKTLILLLLLLLPWWIVSLRSGGTFLYPVVRGNHQPGFQVYNGHLGLGGTVSFIWGFFTLTNYWMFFLPVLFMKPGREQLVLSVFAGILLLLSAAFASQLDYSTALYFHLSRYLVPMAFAFGLYSGGALFRQLIHEPPLTFRYSSLRLLVCLMVAVSLLLFQGLGFGLVAFVDLLKISRATDLQNAMYSVQDGVVIWLHPEASISPYHEAFSKVPMGARVLTAVDYPFELPTDRYKIFSIDEPGVASPPPGAPYFKGPEPFRSYLLQRNIHYLACKSFDSGSLFYSYRMAHALINSKAKYRDSRIFGKYDLEFMNEVDAIASQSKILYDSPEIRIIYLGE